MPGNSSTSRERCFTLLIKKLVFSLVSLRPKDLEAALTSDSEAERGSRLLGIFVSNQTLYQLSSGGLISCYFTLLYKAQSLLCPAAEVVHGPNTGCVIHSRIPEYLIMNGFPT